MFSFISLIGLLIAARRRGQGVCYEQTHNTIGVAMFKPPVGSSKSYSPGNIQLKNPQTGAINVSTWAYFNTETIV
jgi:hypothetical protein